VAESIPIIGGTGALGYGLAVRLLRVGEQVVIGSRKLERATEAAEKLRAAVDGADVEGLENGDAARRGPIIFLTVPFRAHSETLTNLKGSLAEVGARARDSATRVILVDCTVPLAAAISGKATRTIGVWQGSAAQQAQEMAPDGVTVVSALHTVSAPVLAGDEALDEDVLVCGNRRADKRRAAEVIERVDGLRAVDAGPLEQARIVESLTALLIGINGRYKTHAGIRVTGLPDRAPWDE
jgi:8-hydroxy-5-deazaflavin:NADPH oxidoreductase